MMLPLLQCRKPLIYCDGYGRVSFQIGPVLWTAFLDVKEPEPYVPPSAASHASTEEK